VSSPSSAPAQIAIIRRLADGVVNQIAAGEVLERPASAVKELVENAFDAGAKRVDVEIEGSGVERIRVIDDGIGMGPEDAQHCLERHATSKLRSVDDLLAMKTLGFRGEALPSIAGVSRFSLVTRPASDELGTRVVVDGGSLETVERVVTPPGTSVEVRDLFFNVPARRKFLKQAATEVANIQEAVVRLALSRSSVAVTLRSGGKLLLDAPPASSSDPIGRVSRLLGERVVERLHPLIPLVESRPVRVTGFLAEPGLTERSTKGQYTFVNGRFVRDKTIQQAILEAYRSLLERGRKPVVILFIEVPEEEVDVNVHPQKTEVRFARSGSIFSAVHQVLRETLLSQPWRRDFSGAGGDVSSQVGSPVGSSNSGRGSPSTVSALARAGVLTPKFRYSGANGLDVPQQDHSRWLLRDVSSTFEPLFDSEDSKRDRDESSTRPVRFADLRVVGQVLSTYLVCEGPQGLLIVDQHAAHERVTFQRLKRERIHESASSQPLLVPVSIELTASEHAKLTECHSIFEKAGIEVEHFGETTWRIKALPTALAGVDAERLVRDLTQHLSEFPDAAPLEDYLQEVSACAACHRSVRAGDRLQAPEIRALLQAMDEVDFGDLCPHGRPVYVEWTNKDLEKLFHRR
jgi:DNA mismatch repair protein MutL